MHDADDAPTPPGPRPVAPSPEQCCGTACDPCIWTYYHRAVERWEARAALWVEAGGTLDED